MSELRSDGVQPVGQHSEGSLPDDLMRAELDRLRDDLPPEAEAPRIFKLDLDMIEVVALAATSTRDLESLTRLLEDDLARRFEHGNTPARATIAVPGLPSRTASSMASRDRASAATLVKSRGIGSSICAASVLASPE